MMSIGTSRGVGLTTLSFLILSACGLMPVFDWLAPAQDRSYTVTVAKNEQMTITSDISEFPAGWSPDGRRIAYTAFEGRLGAQKVYVGMVTLDDDGRIARADRFLDGFPAKDWGGYWSPDGKKVAFFSNRSGKYDIWVVNSDGTGLIQLTNHAADDLYPTWSPDGKKIAFLSARSREVSIWMMNSDGSEQEQLTAGGNGDWGTAWSPDGKNILFGSARVSSQNERKSDTDEELAESRLLKSFFEKKTSRFPSGLQMGKKSRTDGKPMGKSLRL